MLTLEDLAAMDVTLATTVVVVGGTEVTVRGLSTAEHEEIEYLVPEPDPPTTREHGRVVRDEDHPAHLQAVDTVMRRRRALIAAVAAGITVGEHAWTTEGVWERRLPLEARTVGPGAARAAYARAVVPEVLKRLGPAEVVAIVGASATANAKKKDPSTGSSATENGPENTGN